MKIRLSTELYLRASQCANEVQEPLSRWLWLCTRPANILRATSIFPPPDLLSTRDATIATMQAPDITDPELTRLRIAQQVLLCESLRRPRHTNTLLTYAGADPRPGRDYHLATHLT